MIRGIYTAVSGLVAGEAKQSVITNNIANANTTGFKGENLAVKNFDNVLIKNYDKVVGGKNVKNVIGSLSMGAEIDDVDTDFTQGMFEATEKNTDFALEGKGFFTVQRDDGISKKDYYTRNGHFHVNAGGYLVNDSGDKVLGTNINTGAVEPIFVGNGDMVSDKFGNLRIDDVEKYKFTTVDFEDYKSIKKVGDNLYAGDNPIENETVFVKQQYIEKSNIDVGNEMINMMTVMRNFESNQKVVQALDKMLGKSVNELGRVR